jgi:hypothetical protein
MLRIFSRTREKGKLKANIVVKIILQHCHKSSVSEKEENLHLWQKARLKLTKKNCTTGKFKEFYV